jgi:hypothetical protein
MQESYTGNNITVTKEEKTDIYFEMTEENFNLLIKPQLKAQGMDVSNYSFSKKVNPLGVEVAILSYDAKLDNASVSQKLFCVNLTDFSTAKESTFVITLTQMEKDEDTINHVFETIEQETIKIIK